MDQFYDNKTEQAMKDFYERLNERDKRHFASISTMQLGHGGKNYISDIFSLNPRTIYEGKIEIQEGEVVNDSIRRPGAGRKPIRNTYPNLDVVFLKVLKEHTAGDPMNKKIIWTDLTRIEIVGLLKEEGIDVSKIVVGQLLSKHGYVKRKIQKKKNK